MVPEAIWEVVTSNTFFKITDCNCIAHFGLTLPKFFCSRSFYLEIKYLKAIIFTIFWPVSFKQNKIKIFDNNAENLARF